jgi:hypothetical protein
MQQSPVGVWQLRMTYDYGQIYISANNVEDHDNGDDDEGDDAGDDGDLSMRLLNESFESPHHVGFTPSFVLLNTADRSVFDAPLRTELWAGSLPADLGDWEEVWEFSLTVGAAGVYLSSATTEGTDLPPLPPGVYGCRMSMAGTEEGRWGYPSLEERWLFQFTPVEGPFAATMPRTRRPARSAAEKAAGAELGPGPSISNPEPDREAARTLVRTAPFASVRLSALWYFSGLGHEAEVLWRERAVEDEFPEVRAAAISLVAMNQDPDTDLLPFLIERADGDPDAEIAIAAINAMRYRYLDRPEAQRWLRANTGDLRPAVRAAVLRTRSRIEVEWPATWSDDPELGPLLREFAERDPDPDIRRFAGLALVDGWAHDPAVTEWLRQRAVAVDADEQVAVAAVAVVAARLPDADLLGWVQQTANDPRSAVGAAAVSAVSRTWAQDAAARAWVRQVAVDGAEPVMRAAALQVIAERLPLAPQLDDLGVLVRDRAAVDPDAGVRWAAIEAVLGWRSRLMERHNRDLAWDTAAADAWSWAQRQKAAESDLLAQILSSAGPVLPAAQPEAPRWADLLDLMAGDGSPLHVRGAIRTTAHHGTFAFASSTDDPAIIAGLRLRSHPDRHREPLQVWWSGRRLRLEEPDGTVELIANEKRCYQFVNDADQPVTGRRRALQLMLNGTELLTRRQAAGWRDTGAQPAGPITATTLLGRAAWAVTVVEQHGEEAWQLVVDAATGLLLQRRNPRQGGVDEWVELSLVDGFDDDLFSWAGPTRSSVEWEAAQQAAGQDRWNRAAQWFAANVPTTPLRITVDVQLQVHHVDEATGAFSAGLGHLGLVARRPHSYTRWDEHWAATTPHRWRSDRWDWALLLHNVEATPDSVAALKRHLSDHYD